MRLKYIAITAIISLFTLGLGYTLGIIQNTEQTVPTQATKLDADTIFDLVNQERNKAGLKPLERYSRLDSTANMKTHDMIVNDYFSHDYNGEKIYENIRQIAPECEQKDYWLGENLAVTNESSKSVVEGWLASESHRANMLDPKYTKSGISAADTSSTYQGHKNVTKITQHFCK